MPRFLSDENLNNNIIRGLAVRDPSIDIVRAVDAGLTGASDPALLEFAASQQRVLLTHDVSTLTAHAYERMRRGMAMPGVLEIPEWLGVGAAIQDLLLIAGASLEGEWENQVRYLPLR